MADPNASVTYVDVFGVHVNPADIAVEYRAQLDTWTDMPEARPRQRCRLKAGDDRDPRVFVMTDGELRFDKTDVQVDGYPGEEYAAVRAEGEARWARVDAVKAAQPAGRPVRLVGESGPELTEAPPGAEVKPR